MRIPAGEGLHVREHVDHVVRSHVANVARVEAVEAKRVHLKACHNTKASEEVVRHAELSQRVELGHLPQDREQASVGHIRVGYVEYPIYDF